MGRTVSMSIEKLVIFYLSVFVFGFISTENVGGKVTVDISKVIDEAIKTGVKEESVLKALEGIGVRTNSNPFILFYETDLHNDTSKTLEKVINFLKRIKVVSPNFAPKLIISLKNTQFGGLDNHIVQYDEQNYSKVLSALAQHTRLISSVSFEITDLDCTRSMSQGENIVQGVMTTVENLHLKAFSSKATMIGYVVGHNYIQCTVHRESITAADVLVIKIPLELNDKIFVESYGIFKESMERIVTVFKQEISYYTSKAGNKTVYYKISLNAVLDRMGLMATQVIEGKTVYNPAKQADLNHALAQVRIRNEEVARRYELLLTQYVYEWTRNWNEKDGAMVILSYLHGYDNTYKMDWMTETSGTIPYLTNLPVFGSRHRATSFGVRLAASAGIFLEDVASSGFELVMINKGMWRELANNMSHFAYCSQTGCRPMNVIYMVDDSKPFDPPLRENIQELYKIGGMDLRTVMFSYRYGESPSYQWKDVLSAFREVSESAANANRQLYSGCQTWTGWLTNLAGSGVCDHACLADAIQYVFGCGSITNLTDAFLWSATFEFDSGKVNKFVKDTMSLLDAFVIAREMLWSNYPNRTVILQIRGWYSGPISKIPVNTLYCNGLAERLGQFYEAIITWARIHDFSVIVEMAHGNTGYGNPITWEELSVTSSNGRMKQVMESGPLYVRRSYNQSRVFGSWTQGRYPCIVKAADNSSIVRLNFDHAFSGITVNFDLKSENVSITPEEIQVLLLFSLNKFRNVEAIVPEAHLKSFGEAISGPTFRASLELNGITNRNIYLQVKDMNSDTQKLLRQIISVLKSAGIGLHVMSYSQEDNSRNKISDTFETEIIDSNCTNLAYKIVLRGGQSIDEKFKRAKYLICETEPFTADNVDETSIQDYFNYHFYLKKLLGHFYPNLKEIHFRLQPKFSGDGGIDLHERKRRLLLFLSDVNAYSRAYKIHYFLLPAFVSGDQVDEIPSFWSITNYTNLSDVSVYRDIQAEYLNMTTLTPQISDGNLIQNRSHADKQEDVSSNLLFGFSPEIVYATAAMLVVAIILLVLLICICFKRRFYLSKKDIQEFQNGRQETLKEAVRERRRNRVFAGGNIFDGLVFQKEYELHKREVQLDAKNNALFKGKYSTVYKGTLLAHQKDVVVKIPRKSCSKEVFKGMLSEVKLLCYIGDHGNLVSFIGCHTNEIGKGVLWIVMEFCEGGTLLENLKNLKQDSERSGRWSVQELIRFGREIAAGMEYAAGQNAIHGHLCADNVLLDQFGTCKIKGFELAQRLPEYQAFTKRNQWDKLPWQWMSLESLKVLEFSAKADVWSFGVTLWEIFSLGDTPYPGETLTVSFFNDLEKGKRMSIPPYAPKDTFDVMLKCWKKETAERYEFSELVKYFTDLVPNDSNRMSSQSVNIAKL